MDKTIRVLGSPCMRSSYYRDIVQEVVDEMGLGQTVVKLIDPDEILTYGIRVGCSNAYCPGCNLVNKDRGDTRYTPALAIGKDVPIHSSMPSKKAIREALEKAFPEAADR